MVQCLVCAGGDFYSAHALYFCKICDTQTFDFHDEADFQVGGEFGEAGLTGPVPILGARIAQPSQSQKKPATEDNNRTVLEQADAASKEKSNLGRPFTTFEVFQLILSAQTNKLIQFGFPTILRERVFKIWCIYLSEIGEAFSRKKNYKLDMPKVRERDAFRFTATHTNFIGKRKMSGEKDEGEEPADNSKDPLLTQGTGENYDSKYPPNKLTMNVLVCILYLAISLTNPLYTISHLIRWIKEGTIPYFNADKILPKDMKFVSKDHHVLTHLVLPSHYGLRMLTASLARYLDFSNYDFIPVDMELLCTSYIMDLDLPGELVNLTLSLIQSKKPYMRFTPCNADPRRTGIPPYEAVALSYIIIVLKDLFGFQQLLEHHLSSYAAALQCDLPAGNNQLFNVEKWMQQQMISRDKQSELPQHNLDTQRLGSLQSVIRSYSSIAPPATRYASTQGIRSLKINQDNTRKQLQDTLQQLSLGIKDRELQRQKKSTQDEVMQEDDCSSTVSSHYTTATFWSQPGVTSTQRQSQDESSQQTNKEVEETELDSSAHCKFREHTVAYLVNHKKFCKTRKLFKRHNYDSVKDHVQQYVKEAHVDDVTRALLSGGNYCQYGKDELQKSAALQLLFHICAEYASLTIKELTDVYFTIEEAYICLQNHLSVPSLSGQSLYFPRKSQQQHTIESNDELLDGSCSNSSRSPNSQMDNG